ncbi:MAG: FprA family A-type flavoprotein, partial [Thermoplasmata archaeon]|nr:FprA family A-type flavoprotein [Thermoplasmata archaeon]
LPDGTSYNSYLVKGSEKNALIDTVDPEKKSKLFENLDRSGVERIDYVVANHAEQDHSGSIPMVLERYPEAKVVTNEKCKGFLMDLLFIPEEKFIVVGDGNTLSLGDRTLKFIIAPWVHWPETMFTYLKEDKILFSCDFLGSHLATSGLFVTDEARVYEAAKRYYAEIMMPFRTMVKKHLKRVRELEPDIIAPSHGPVYDRPEFILNAYDDWVKDESRNKVIIAYVSMHGSVKKMVDHLADALMEKGITVIPFNLTNADLGKIAISLVDAATIVIAAPTVLTGPHPAALYATAIVNALRPKLKYAAIIGSCGWGGKMVEQLTGMLSNLKVELLDPIMVKGHPKEADFKALG